MGRVLILLGVLMSFTPSALAQMSDAECFRRFNACAAACSAFGHRTNIGCVGRCLRINGCPIDDGNTPSGMAPDDSLPDNALQGSTVPGDALPRSSLPADALPEASLPGSHL